MKELEELLKTHPQLRKQLDDAFGTDVLAHMKTGKSGLKNPPKTELHHPIDTPEHLEVLRTDVHRNPELQDILHPDNIGGFGTYYGK